MLLLRLVLFRLFDRFRGRCHRERLGLSSGGNSIFSIGFSGSGSGSASGCGGPGGTSFGVIFGETGDGRQIDHDHRRVGDQIGILAPSRKQRRSAGRMKSKRKHKTRAPAGGLGPPAETRMSGCAPTHAYIFSASSPTSATCR